jgi:hypothetical protein
MIPLVASIIWLGLFPQPVMNTVKKLISSQFAIEKVTANTENKNGDK